MATVTNTVLLDGYVFRDENLLKASSEGGVNYLFDDGEKVGANTVIANIYSGAGAEEVADRILQIDKELDILKNSSVSEKITKSDADIIDKKINELYFKICENIANDDLEYAYFRKDEFLTYLNKRQIITKNTEDFEEQIITLTRERETLSGQLINLEENIMADKSGYFYSEVDGFEDIFNVSLIENMTLASFDELIKSSPKDYSTSLTVGKLVNSTEWYILSSVSVEETKLFGIGNSYSIKFPFNADMSVSMTLDKIIRENDVGNAVLVFRTNEMPDGFNFFRKQTVQIARESYTGYKVPADAVRVVDGVEGVYVLSGNTVSSVTAFCAVSAVTAGNGSSIAFNIAFNAGRTVSAFA